MTERCNRVVLGCFISQLLVAAPAAAIQLDEVSLRAADAEEMRLIVQRDSEGEREFMHPNYMVNSPANRVVRKDELIRMLSEGKIANNGIERTIEATAITGNVGIVMGRETITPTPNSELGQSHSARKLERRFTNVFLFENGKWWFLARQSTVIGPSP